MTLPRCCAAVTPWCWCAGGASHEEVYAAGVRAAQEFEKASEYTRKNQSKHTDAQTRCALERRPLLTFGGGEAENKHTDAQTRCA